jgi:hypothetical protein
MKLIDADRLKLVLAKWLGESVGPVHNTLSKVLTIIDMQEELTLGEAVDRTIEIMRRLP